jgi:hypothetical protein
MEFDKLMRTEIVKSPDVKNARLRVFAAESSLNKQVTLKTLQERKDAMKNYREARIPDRKELVIFNRFRIILNDQVIY